jgi:lysophospholipid acyltransferase (LPLAT)-like uncharacterized protein
VSEPSSELRFTLWQRIQLTLVSWIVPALLRLIGCTLRTTMTYEEGAIQSLAEVYPGIFPFWHRCVLPATWLYRNQHPAVMTSRSRDGEFIARVISRFGFIPVRGSSSRGGERALRKMNKLLAEGNAVAFTIDGPRGPRYVAKRGPVILARMSGTPITGFYVAVEHAWVLNTWDALMVPKPFSRIYVRFARKIFVPPDADDEAMEQYQAEMQAALERITAFAESQFRERSSQTGKRPRRMR